MKTTRTTESETFFATLARATARQMTADRRAYGAHVAAWRGQRVSDAIHQARTNLRRPRVGPGAIGAAR